MRAFRFPRPEARRLAPAGAAALICLAPALAWAQTAGRDKRPARPAARAPAVEAAPRLGRLADRLGLRPDPAGGAALPPRRWSDPFAASGEPARGPGWTSGSRPFFAAPAFGERWPRLDADGARRSEKPAAAVAAGAFPPIPSSTLPPSPLPSPSLPSSPLVGPPLGAAKASPPVGGEEATRPAFAANAFPSPRLDRTGASEPAQSATASVEHAPAADKEEARPVTPDESVHQPRPSRFVAALERLQTRIAAGDPAAQAAQGPLVAEIERQFEIADPAIWASRREATAQMTLLLSGGDPRAARRRLAAGRFGANTDLIDAGLAFAEGRGAQARRLLTEIEPNGVDELARAQAALTAATLASSGPAADPVEADRLFDQARLAAPGTLIEETALRRQTRLAETQGDVERFARLAGAHLRRFPRSVYGAAFRDMLPDAAARLAIRAKVETPDALAPLLTWMTSAERAATFDALARIGLAQGAFKLALASARRALETGPSMTVSSERAALFALVAGSLDDGPAVVNRLTAAHAPDAETEALRQAALAFVSDIYEWPPSASSEPPEQERAKDSPAIARATRSLREGDALLASAAGDLNRRPNR